MFPHLYLTVCRVWSERALYYSTHLLPRNGDYSSHCVFYDASLPVLNIFLLTTTNPNRRPSFKGPLQNQSRGKVVPAREESVFELDLGDYLAQIFSNCAEQTLWSLCKEHENGEGRKGQPYRGGGGLLTYLTLPRKKLCGKNIFQSFRV